eukprot:4257349-Amphidinium_carterae.1
MSNDVVSHISLPRVVGATESGESLDHEQKVWVHESGIVLWELRRLCVGYLPRRQTLELSRYIKDNRANMAEWFERTGAVDAIRESLQSVKSRGLDANSYNHAEYSITTRGAIALLLGSSLFRRGESQKQLCLHMFVGLLRAVNPEQVVLGSYEAITDASLRQRALEQCHLCRVSPSGVLCLHLHQVLQEFGAGDPASFHVDWVRTLQRLYTDANVCPAMEPMLRSVVAMLSESIDAALAREDRAQQIRGTTVLRNAGSNKRLRIDEDLKAFLAVEQT